MKLLQTVVLVVVGVILGILASVLINYLQSDQTEVVVPFITPSPSPKPLLAYTIPALQQRTYVPRQITVESVVEDTDDFTSYIVSFQPLDKRMTALLNVPKPLPATAAAVVMLRGYAPPEGYVSGTGSKNSSRALARAGFVTIAPDFFGYGESAPEPTDSWQARFEKPIIVAELLAGLEQFSLSIPTTLIDPTTTKQIRITSLGLWGHSNGGQIALSTLEVLQSPIPTVLWAPVTAPFPYSILFFSDEYADEGKETRKWLSLLERDYDVLDFSLTQYLDSLRGPIQLHHGTADEAALKTWSDEFVAKVELENERRNELAATDSAALSPIEVEYFVYPGADHNLTPGWDVAMARTTIFFTDHLR